MGVQSRPVSLAGFTLIDIMVSMGIFSMVTVAMVYAHLFGLRYNQLVESKLGASDDARRGLGELCLHVRTAKFHSIGNMGNSGFEALEDGVQQRGNALQLILTTNQSSSITYYFETNTPGNFTLRRIRTGNLTPQIIASHLTNNFQNSLVFIAEDHKGEPIYDLSNRRVVRFILDFCQYQYPLTQVGPGNFYDRYKMEFRLTPHVPEGR